VPSDYGAHDITIVAEINNAPRLTMEAVVAEAERYRASGADIVDIGCTPGLAFPWLAEAVRELRGRGMRVSVDSLDPDEIRAATGAGAELVLSVNGSNLEVARDAAADGARVVVIPDGGAGLDSIVASVARLDEWGVPYLIDPIIEPIGMGFARSLVRYAEARARWPEAELMMGIGNITELTAADTTGVNAILIAFCQEMGVRTVLTTEVIPWARGAVREVDIARRLMHHAVTHATIPKAVDDRLVTVKDARILAYGEEELRALQARVRDANFRIFADGRTITVLNRERFVTGTEIQPIFDQLGVTEASHAFYLGKELMKAKLAITLGKTYRQEGSLDWGYLTPADDARQEHVRLTQRSDRSARAAAMRARAAAAGEGDEGVPDAPDVPEDTAAGDAAEGA
jgi:dihydropteroate synthase-like protein